MSLHSFNTRKLVTFLWNSPFWHCTHFLQKRFNAILFLSSLVRAVFFLGTGVTTVLLLFHKRHCHSDFCSFIQSVCCFCSDQLYSIYYHLLGKSVRFIILQNCFCQKFALFEWQSCLIIVFFFFFMVKKKNSILMKLFQLLISRSI